MIIQKILIFATTLFTLSEADSLDSLSKKITAASLLGYGKMTAEQVYQIDQIFGYAGYDTSLLDDSTKLSLSYVSVSDPVIDQYQEDFKNLGKDEMIRQGRVLLSKIIQYSKQSQPETPPIYIPRLGKRSQALFQVDFRNGTQATWGSPVLMTGICASGLQLNGEKANFIQWWVQGYECKYVLYEEDWCMGKTAYSTENYNIDSDGSRYNSGFQSVFFRCR